MPQQTLSGNQRRLVLSGVVAAIIIGGLAMASVLWHHEPAEKSATANFQKPADYRAEAAAATADYEAFIEGKAAVSVVSRRREQLLSLTVKPENRELHLRLVQTADSLLASEETGRSALEKLYSEYPWLKP